MKLTVVAPLALLAALAGCDALRDAEPSASTGTAAGPAPAPSSAAAPGKGTTTPAPVLQPVPDGGVAPVDHDPPPTCDGGLCPPELFASTASASRLLVMAGTNVFFQEFRDDPRQGKFEVMQCSKADCSDASRIALAVGTPSSLVVVGNTAYWPNGDTILSCAVGGCNGAPTVVIGGQGSARFLTTDGTFLYWVSDGPKLTPYAVRCPIAGCTAASVTQIGPAFTNAPIVVASGFTFWADQNISVQTCAATGCDDPFQVVEDRAAALATDGTNVFWSTTWGDSKRSGIFACVAAGCTTAVLFAPSPSPDHVVTDGQHVFWNDTKDDALYRCPTSGCPASGPELLVKPLAGADPSPEQLALDEDYIYWSTTRGIQRLKIHE